MIRGLLKFFLYGHSHSAPWILGSLNPACIPLGPLNPRILVPFLIALESLAPWFLFFIPLESSDPRILGPF